MSEEQTNATDVQLPSLNNLELEVMKVIWRQGKLSAREVHRIVGGDHGWALSTTRTVLERMVAKGLLAKAPFHGLNLYEPKVSRPAGLARIVRDFAANVLEIDSAPVVSLFVDSQSLPADELEQLSEYVSRLEAEAEEDDFDFDFDE